MYLYSLVLMIHAFDLYSYIVHVFYVLTSCICPSCINYWLYIYILEPRAFMHIICGLIMFRICMYTLVCTWHTYALKFKSCFDDFHVFRWFHIYDEYHVFKMISIGDFNFRWVSCFYYWAWLSIFMLICFSQHLYTHLI